MNQSILKSRGRFPALVVALVLMAVVGQAQSLTARFRPGTNFDVDAGLNVYKHFDVEITSPEDGGYEGTLVFQFHSGAQTVQHVFAPSVAQILPKQTITIGLNLFVPDSLFGASDPYDWTIEIHGQSGNEQQLLATLKLPAVVHNFHLTAAPTSQEIRARNPAVFTVYKTVDPSGFTTDLWMRAYGLPKYATAVFVPDTMRATDQQSTLTIKTKANTPPGKYEIWIKGYYFSQAVPVHLTVTR